MSGIQYTQRLLIGLLAGTAINSPATADPSVDEPIRFIVANHTSQPAATFTDMVFPASVESRDYQLRMGDLQFQTTNTRFLAGVDYQYTRNEYQDVDSRDRDLHRLAVPIQFKTDSTNWRIDGYFAPVIATSSNVFKDFLNRGSARDVYLSSRVEFHAQNAPWFFGAAYDRRFGSAHAYPVFGTWLNWSPGIDIRLAFPDPAALIQVSERLTASLRIYPAGHEWRVVSDDFASEFDYRMKAIRSELNWNVKLTGKLSLDLTIGYEIDRELRLVDRRGESVDSRVSNEWLFMAGFRFGNAALPYSHGGRYGSEFH